MTRRLIIDEQLPPALADFFRDHGFDATHVFYMEMHGASDREIWENARSSDAIIVTKDEDFATRSRTDDAGPTVVWIRLGNVGNRALRGALERMLPALVEALENNERLIEIDQAPD